MYTLQKNKIWLHHSHHWNEFLSIVIYWPSTEPSIKRCTCVNKQRNSVSRWKWDNYITRCHRRLGSVPVGVGASWGQDANVRASGRQRADSDPRLSSPTRMRKKCCYGQKNLGSICSSLSPSPTHLSHTTNINPFENKVWEIYFYKEVCSFVHWNSSLCLIRICICIRAVVLWVYNTMRIKTENINNSWNNRTSSPLIFNQLLTLMTNYKYIYIYISSFLWKKMVSR